MLGKQISTASKQVLVSVVWVCLTIVRLIDSLTLLCVAQMAETAALGRMIRVPNPAGSPSALARVVPTTRQRLSVLGAAIKFQTTVILGKNISEEVFKAASVTVSPIGTPQ